MIVWDPTPPTFNVESGLGNKAATIQLQQNTWQADPEGAEKKDESEGRSEEPEKDSKADSKECVEREKPAAKRSKNSKTGPQKKEAGPAGPAGPLSKDELKAKVSKEVEVVPVESDMLEEAESLASKGHFPSDSSEKYSQLVKLSPQKIKSLLHAAWLPQEGSKERIIIRLLRYLADWFPTPEDMELFREAGLACAPSKRLRGKRAVTLPPPQEQPKPRAPRAPRARQAVRTASVRGAKASKAVPTVPSADELVALGHLPEDSVDRYQALCKEEMAELQEMAQQLWLPSEGRVDQVALRIVRKLAGRDQLEVPKQPKQPKEPKRLKRAKMGAASRLGRGRGRGGGRGGRATGERTNSVPKSRGLSKKALRTFLASFLEHADVERTTFRELKEAAFEEFGDLNDETVVSLRDMAAVAMRKQLGVRRGKAAKADKTTDAVPSGGEEDAEQSSEKPAEDQGEPVEEAQAAALLSLPPENVPNTFEKEETDQASEVKEPVNADVPKTDQAKEAKDSDSDSDSVSISPIDYAALATPASPLLSPKPRSFMSREKPKEPKVPVSKAARARTNTKVSKAQELGEDVKESAKEAVRLAQDTQKMPAEVKEAAGEEPKSDAKGKGPPKRVPRFLQAARSVREAKKDKKGQGLVYVSGSGQKLSEHDARAKMLQKKEAEEKKRKAMENLVFDGVTNTLSRFVRYSMLHEEKRQTLAEVGHLDCRITVPAAVWNSNLEVRLKDMVDSFAGQLEQEKRSERKSIVHDARQKTENVEEQQATTEDADTCANAQASTASSTQLKEPSDASEATQPSDASGVLHAKTDAEATTATHAESKQMDDPDGEATSAAGKVEDSNATPAAAGEAGPEDMGKASELPESTASEHKPRTLSTILEDPNSVPLPLPVPATPAFATVQKPSGKVAKPVKVQKWRIKFTPKALEMYLRKQPALLGVSDAKVAQFARAFVSKARPEEIKILDFFQHLWKRFGEQFPEKKHRHFQILKTAFAAKEGEKKRGKGKDGEEKPNAKVCECQKERKMSAGNKTAALIDEESDIMSLEDDAGNSDLLMAARILAPFGMDSKDVDVLVKPPPSQALPVLKGLRSVASWDELQSKLTDTKLLPVVKSLKRHSDRDVAHLAKELMESFRVSCKQAKTKRESKEALEDKVPAKDKVPDGC
ncbi:Hypothetical protein (Fragment) [Durusdinium trenchii]|uniref:Uncharacterized protein n=1 Tax=Durusdinium trenchii TaxID=1381693 RepID=A0ABP0JGE4_9DINO